MLISFAFSFIASLLAFLFTGVTLIGIIALKKKILKDRASGHSPGGGLSAPYTIPRHSSRGVR
jgi:hypothetical protein